MFKLKKKNKVDPDVAPNYNTSFSGDHQADKIAVLGCLLLMVVLIGAVLFWILR